MKTKSVFKVKCIWSVCCTVVLFMVSSIAYAIDAKQQPLIQSSDITYVGSFKLPRPGTEESINSFDYGGMGLAVSEDGKTLYVGGHIYNQSLGRVVIPDTVGGTASIVQAPVKIPGSIGGSCGANEELSGALVYNGRLIVQKRCYYDLKGEVGSTHAVGNLNISGFSPFTRLSNLTYKQYANGYMGLIPPEWQPLLGGPAFTGNSVMSINSQCSNGPSFYVFNPNHVGVLSPIPSDPLMNFPYPYGMLANPDVPNNLFSRADQYNAGIVFPSGTRSILFFSRHGYGNPTYKKDDGGCGGESGEGAAPYRRQITAFDANDLLAVKNGKKLPYEIKPYAWWTVPGPTDSCSGFTYSGLAYDPISRRIYGALLYGNSPEIHVWQVSGANAPPPPPNISPSPPSNLRVE